MKQQCNIRFVWLTWISLPVIALYIGFSQGWLLACIVVVVGVVAQIVYLRIFPNISKIMGYGSVVDETAKTFSSIQLPIKVILYTANVCPFCPIIKQRLVKLKRDLGFDLVEVDVTFRPDIVRSKVLRSVPVVEVNKQLLIGNSTSAQLAKFLTDNVKVA